MDKHRSIIQGGMGIAVSNWTLARTVAMAGGIGVVSGTAINSVLVRRLQDGDPDGSQRRALQHFPVPEIAEKILKDYFIPGGKAADKPYKRSPLFARQTSLGLLHLTIAANFVEVFLAKEGHDNPIGLNLLEKIQMPNIPSIYGAMLAGVDYVIMGAGIPREIPGVLDALAKHQKASLKLQVDGASPEDNFQMEFDPETVLPQVRNQELKRPFFLAIVSSVTLAMNLAKKATGHVDGFIIEHHTAGGHNAPPRGALKLSETGEPIYGDKDEVDLVKFSEIGRPFWLAGSCARPEKLKWALSQGAQGIQVGTAFAFCNESGLDPEIKNSLRKEIWGGRIVNIFTDPLASPSGFPFKVIRKENTLSEESVYQARPRKCDLGYLRTAYKKEDGLLGYRCAAEPIADYLKKGGSLEETKGRKCLCNGLITSVKMGQVQESGYKEADILTAGDDISELRRFMGDSPFYSAKDVLDYLLDLKPLRQQMPAKTMKMSSP